MRIKAIVITYRAFNFANAGLINGRTYKLYHSLKNGENVSYSYVEKVALNDCKKHHRGLEYFGIEGVRFIYE